ncbi:MAG: glycosyltransferase family 2 protein [Candidatus Omnitrophota bacterium]
MKLSVVIPAHNEQECIESVLIRLSGELETNKIEYEIVVVNDNSTDKTAEIVASLAKINSRIRVINNQPPNGFGRAIRKGLESFSGDIVVICMGDDSDDPEDVVKYYQKILEGYDCVFGSRFLKGSHVSGYPKLKLLLNRLGNKFIQLLFMINYNDTSNAFKAYRREAIQAVQPLVSQHFNITVEIPLKAIVRGFSYAIVPINWQGRDSGVSKYRIKDLSRKYFFSILYVWLEKILLQEEIGKQLSLSRRRAVKPQ